MGYAKLIKNYSPEIIPLTQTNYNQLDASVKNNGNIYVTDTPQLYQNSQGLIPGTATTTDNGLLPKLDGGTTKYLRADGSWAIPPNTTYASLKNPNALTLNVYSGTSTPTATTYDGSSTRSAVVASNTAITNITRSGTTFTATRANGTTFTFTQQDSNTTYTSLKNPYSLTLNVYSGTTAATATTYDGSTIKSANVASNTAITNITRSGTTFTATRANGQTFTFTQQDNNSLTGVKGNNEGSYRTGNVNLTPDNIGALPANGGTMSGNLTINKSTPTIFFNSPNATNPGQITVDTNGHLKVATGNYITTLDLGGNFVNILVSESAQVRNTSDSAWMPIGASAFNTKSTRRVKENIQDISDEHAKKLLDVNVVTYDYKQNIVNDNDRYNRTGVIAEDVNAIIPEVVKYDENGIPDMVDYSRFVPYLIRMVQIQENRIEVLEEKLKKYEQKIQR